MLEKLEDILRIEFGFNDNLESRYLYFLKGDTYRSYILGNLFNFKGYSLTDKKEIEIYFNTTDISAIYIENVTQEEMREEIHYATS